MTDTQITHAGLSPCPFCQNAMTMNPPAPMTDPNEDAAKRVIAAWCHCDPASTFATKGLTSATEQMRKEREAWEAGR